MAKKARKKSTLIADFKKFISRGSILDMAVGVVIGGAFSAIVTALVGILLSLATWAVPGGIKGLVTVLPALTEAQKGLDPLIGLGQSFSASSLQDLARALAEKIYGATEVANNLNLVESVKSTILGKYTLHGTTYTFNMCAVIDWGTFINAVISFFIVAITLFTIVKIAANITKMREEMKAKALEAYYVKHPEERPVPPEPGVPEPTDHEILKEMLAVLKASKSEEKAK